MADYIRCFVVPGGVRMTHPSAGREQLRDAARDPAFRAEAPDCLDRKATQGVAVLPFASARISLPQDPSPGQRHGLDPAVRRPYLAYPDLI